MESTIVQWSAGGIFVLMLINTVINMSKKKNCNGRDIDHKLMEQTLETVANNIEMNTKVLQDLAFKTEVIYKKLV
jgi:hypothetical protein